MSDAASTGPVRVKVCGITSAADARMAESAGADWIGLNFHPPSPRFVDEDRAADILDALTSTTRPIGLFVDRPGVEILELASRLGLTMVQLHGEEPPEDVARLKQAGLFVVRAFRIKNPQAITRLSTYLRRCSELAAPPDAVLFDAYVAGVPGGTGKSIADELLLQLPRVPNLILAGGLTPENVASHVAVMRPWMVDVAGGVECAPGRKDRAKLVAFVREAKRPRSEP